MALEQKTLIDNTVQSESLTSYYGVSLEDLEAYAQDDWMEIKDNAQALNALANMIQTTQLMKAGIRPPEYTKACHCKCCTWVWLWDGCPREVLGCPWCHIRAPGVSIPRPSPPSSL